MTDKTPSQDLAGNLSVNLAGNAGDGKKRAGRKKRPTAGDFKRFLAERAEHGFAITPLPADPQELIAEFQRYVFAKRQQPAQAVADANIGSAAVGHAPLVAFPAQIDGAAPVMA
jgi:hypothetical protein